jgi:hypothetical protein
MPDAAAASLPLPLLHRTPHLAIVLLANAAWELFPLLVLYRMGGDRPFTERAP